MISKRFRRNDNAGRKYRITSYNVCYTKLLRDGELIPVSTTLRAAERCGFEVRDVESLREHYLITLRHWIRPAMGGRSPNGPCKRAPRNATWRGCSGGKPACHSDSGVSVCDLCCRLAGWSPVSRLRAWRLTMAMTRHRRTSRRFARCSDVRRVNWKDADSTPFLKFPLLIIERPCLTMACADATSGSSTANEFVIDP